MTEQQHGAVHDLLEQAGVPHRMVPHPPTYTAASDAEATGLPAARVAKTVVTIEDDTLRLAVVPASRRLDLHRLRAALHAGEHLRLATEEELAEAFPEFEVGAIPPLGRLVGAEEVVDALLAYEPEILVAAGDHAHGALLSPDDLVRVAGARIADISEHTEDDHARRFRDLPAI
jgi:Ala-tRNA(Pro) deacylase